MYHINRPSWLNPLDDNSAVKCTIDNNDMEYLVQNGTKEGWQITACQKPNEQDINIYQERVSFV